MLRLSLFTALSLFAALAAQDPRLSEIVPGYRNPERLAGGRGDEALYKLEVDGTPYVVRLYGEESGLLERVRQIQVAEAAAKTGIAPAIRAVGPAFGGIAMDLVVGQPATPETFASSKKLTQFARGLREFHDSGTPFPSAWSLFERFHQHKRSNLLDDASHTMGQLELLLMLHPIPNGPAHMDLSPGNIFQTDTGFVLIDWTDGGLGDPYDDLSHFALFYCQNPSHVEKFLAAYFGRPPTQLEEDRFIVSKAACLFLHAAAFLPADAPPATTLPTFCEWIAQRVSGVSDISGVDLGHLFLREANERVGTSQFKAAVERLTQSAENQARLMEGENRGNSLD